MKMKNQKAFTLIETMMERIRQKNKEQGKKQHELVFEDYMQRADDAKTEEEADAIRAEWQKIDTAFEVALIRKYGTTDGLLLSMDSFFPQGDNAERE